jgi:sec-independent protein translocase protein TatA
MNPTNFAGNFGSPTQLIVILVIVLVLFGTKRLRSIGGDLGEAIKGFKKGLSDDKQQEPEATKPAEKLSDETQKTTTDSNTVSEKNKQQ